MPNTDKDKNITVEESKSPITEINDKNTDDCDVCITKNDILENISEKTQGQSTEQTSLQDSEQKEKMVNLAGPSMASIAVSHMRRITGNTKRSLELRKESPLKIKYLKKGIKQRIAELEEEFEKERLEQENEINKNQEKTDRNTDSLEVKSRFYDRAIRRISYFNAEKNTNLSKIRNNFRIFIIIIMGLALYYGYCKFTRNSDEHSLISLRGQLPLKLDAQGQTILQKIDTVDNSVIVTIVKAENSINDSEEFSTALDSFVKNVSNKFCNIEHIVQLTQAGKTVKVNIDASNNSYHREFICDKNNRLHNED